MVIRMRKHKRKCDSCGQEFETINDERFECDKCFLKGKTYNKWERKRIKH